MRRATVKIAGRLGWDIANPYLDWVRDQIPSASALAAQRRWARTTPDLPRFTLILRPDAKMRTNLSRTLRSLRRQTYCHWSTVVLRAEADVSAVTLSQIGSECDFVGIMRVGDTLSPEALYEFARAIVDRDPRPDVLYCDEDHLARDGRTRCRPNFKPSWSPETLLGYHYTGRLTLARRTLLEEVGGLDPSLGDAAEWDLILRLSERTDRIVRIPLCLYHNGSDMYSGDDVHRRTVLESHLKRIGISDAQAVEQPNSTFRVTWPLKHRPLVSVIIPTVDSPGLIRNCVEGLLEKTDYPDKEVILVDSGTTDPTTLSLYREWSSSSGVSIIPFNEPFNYSMACNLGASFARGENLLFLNNDIEIVDPGWLEELVRWAQLPGVGVVGTKLLYPDGKIQHAGIVLSDFTRHIFYQKHDELATAPTCAIFGTPSIYRNVTALTGACHLLRRSLFDEIGGYDTRCFIAGSDIILCLRASKLGYRNLYTPHAALIHHESSTRVRSDPGDDLLLLAQWLRELGLQEDPFFHPELDPARECPAVRPTWAETSSAHLRRIIEEMTAFEHGRELTTLGSDWSPRAMLRKLSDRSSTPRVSAEEVGSNIESAIWFVIDLLRRDESLPRRFPLALSEEAEGEFCNWLCSEGIVRYGLPPGAAQTIRAAFASQPGDQVSRLIDFQGLENPLFRIARMPHLLGGLGTWLFQHGSEHGISNQRVWWFLLESAEDPIRELVRVYMTNPDWQKYFPDAMSPPGWKRLTHWLRERYSLDATGCDNQPHSPSRVRHESCSMPSLSGSK
jgi:GT2 family glycosyltransferase